MNRLPDDPMRHRLALLLLPPALSTLVMAGCTLQSDAQYSASQAQRARERAADANKLATQQTPRGAALTTVTLTAAIAGKTLVNRYERPPWGKPEPYVLQRYFAPDGKYVVVDTPSTYAQSASDQDRWRVENDQLCIKGPPNAHRWQCYRMARAVDGALQWYVDEPDSPAHQQLTVVTREIVDGPPRR